MVFPISGSMLNLCFPHSDGNALARSLSGLCCDGLDREHLQPCVPGSVGAARFCCGSVRVATGST